MTLRNIKNWPKTEYNSKIDNIVTEFFNPALIESTSYKRIAGLFSSNSLALAARGISELIENEGKMEMIIRPSAAPGPVPEGDPEGSGPGFLRNV